MNAISRTNPGSLSRGCARDVTLNKGIWFKTSPLLFVPHCHFCLHSCRRGSRGCPAVRCEEGEEAKRRPTGCSIETEAVSCVPEADTVLRMPATPMLGGSLGGRGHGTRHVI